VHVVGYAILGILATMSLLLGLVWLNLLRLTRSRPQHDPRARAIVAVRAGRWLAFSAVFVSFGATQSRLVMFVGGFAVATSAYAAETRVLRLVSTHRSRLGTVSETEARQELWGGETRKAVANFPVSGEPIPVPVARWLGRIKAAAARVNAELGLLDADKAERIGAAGDRIAAGELDDQFPIDVFQTGSGTSSNMNANEVIASLAGEGVHANDDVNMGQSSNDVFPSAVHLAALDEATNDLLPAMEKLATALEAKAAEFADIVKSGRTHLMDAVPVTLGQEFGGYAAQVRQGIARVQDALPRLGEIPLGGTAVGTGMNTHPEFAARVREKLSAATGLRISAPADPFEAQAARDGLVEASGALKVVAVSYTKIANDLRLMGSGPRAGLAEIFLPELQKGSSIMPGKVNPVIPEVTTQVAAQVIGNDAAITVGGMQGHFELNVFIPLLARNLLQSIRLLAAASRLLAEKCVDGIEANRENCERYAELTLSAATALNPYIGYDRATEIVKAAAASGRSLREVAREKGVEEAVLDEALDYRRMAKPQK
jgi:fumarate hydratase class II